MADQHTPTPWPNEPESNGPNQWLGTTPPWYVAAVAAILVMILAVLVLLVLNGNDDQGVQTAPAVTTTDSSSPTLAPVTTPTTAATSSSVETTTSTTDPSSSTSTTVPTTDESTTTSQPTTTSDPTTTTTVDPFVAAVWPWLDSSTRYDDPVDAARGFAVDFVGFDDPIIGPFHQGDTRSGEIEIRPETDGPATVVFVRQVTADDTWWIVGAATEYIEITRPDALEEIANPFEVTGRAMAFEGVVDVELRADHTETPLATGVVTGGGTEMAPFDGSFAFEWPNEPGGAVVLRTLSAENGEVWEAAVVRIRFPLPG